MCEDWQEDSPRAVSETELARRIDVSTAVLRKWRREGNGPRFLKLGRLVRYLVSDVDAWLDARSFHGGAQVSSRWSVDKRCGQGTDRCNDH
jgi:predicted DNA-binding transcriptional regulator AlpA